MNTDKKNIKKNTEIESDSDDDEDEIQSSSDESNDEEEEIEESENEEDSDDDSSVVSKNKNIGDKNDDKYDENENCYAKEISLDDDDEINFENINETQEIIKKNGRMTKPFLEKYEVVKLLAVRSKQLAQGAKAMLKSTLDMSNKEIAKEELKLKVMPLILVRPIPNSEPEKWYLKELDYSKIMSMIE